jgi:hypothetical protein
VRTISVPALVILGADLPDVADPNGTAELVDARQQFTRDGNGAYIDTAWTVPRLHGRSREIELLLDQRSWERIRWQPSVIGDRPRGYDLTKLGRQMAAGEITERDLAVWLWIFALNGGRIVTFSWNDRTLNLGGPDELARAPSDLVRLGWIEVTEDPELGTATITPTPGKSAIRR